MTIVKNPKKISGLYYTFLFTSPHSLFAAFLLKLFNTYLKSIFQQRCLFFQIRASQILGVISFGSDLVGHRNITHWCT